MYMFKNVSWNKSFFTEDHFVYDTEKKQHLILMLQLNMGVRQREKWKKRKKSKR